MKLYDPATSLHYHEPDDSLTVVTTQDVEPILEANKRQYDVDNKRHKGESFHLAARIPLVVVEQWLREGIDVFKDEDLPKVRAKLNSNEYRYLRTRPGRI